MGMAVKNVLRKFNMEVEMRFKPSRDCRERLARLGATLERRRRFRDRYYDTPESYALMLRDHWLRKRDEAWQLKWLPAAARRGYSLKERSVESYLEEEDKQRIAERVKEVLQIHTRGQSSGRPHLSWNLDELVQEGALSVTADFVTSRESYHYGAGGRGREGEGEGVRVQVDLDDTDMGYSVGEVEVIVDLGWEEGGGAALEPQAQQGLKLQQAKETVQMVARQLGMWMELAITPVHNFLL